MDFRVLSGMIGEVFAKELTSFEKNLIKNPYLNGYPDLLENSSEEMSNYFKKATSKNFTRYKYGGIEVKNSFGSKISKSSLTKGDKRILNIKSNIEWKAHHQESPAGYKQAS